jgi:two-component system cell cycle response regulator
MALQSTILIVDDEPRGRETLEALLIPLGHRLEFAGSGAQSLEQAKAIQPDLILLDVMMPDMDGFEVCRRLRLDPDLAEVPVFLVTALDDKDSKVKGLESGADDFVSKPYDRIELRARVKTVLRLNRYRRLVSERRRFSNIAEQSPEGFLVVNPKGDIQYANRQARLFLGIPADIPNADCGSFARWADRHYQRKPEGTWADWNDPRLTMGTARYLVRPAAESSEACWLRVERLDGDLIEGELVHLRDVTKEIEASGQILQFQSVVSRKLRNPVASLIGCLEVALADLPAGTDSDLAELLKLGFENAKRLESDVTDILNYIDAQRKPGPRRSFRLGDLEAKVQQILEEMSMPPASVRVDPILTEARIRLSADSLATVLRELLENSRNFHPSRTPSLGITAGPGSDGKIVLRVADDGVTLSPSQLAHAWAPYYQGNKFSDEEVGMGLGLATVAAIVWNVGGNCRLLNRDPGPGVICEIVLPLQSHGIHAQDSDR